MTRLFTCILRVDLVVRTTQPLPPSRNFPDGRWFNNTMGIKDAWVEQHYNAVVNQRVEIEGDKDLQKQGEKETLSEQFAAVLQRFQLLLFQLRLCFQCYVAPETTILCYYHHLSCYAVRAKHVLLSKPSWHVLRMQPLQCCVVFPECASPTGAFVVDLHARG